MEIFLVFDEFLPYSPFQLSILTTFTQSYAEQWKLFAAFTAQFCAMNGNIFRIKIKDFYQFGKKSREEIGKNLFEEGKKLDLLTKIFTLDFY